MAAGRFPVEAGHVLTFTRALGAADPDGGLPAAGDVAPPTFAIASAQFDPEYPLRPRPWTPKARGGSGGSCLPEGGPGRWVPPERKEPAERPWHGSGGGTGLVTEGAGGLHAEQHFVYHRPIRVGDVLVPTSRPGEAWEKQGRSGRLRFRERITEFRDEAGQLVVTAVSVSVLREKP